MKNNITSKAVLLLLLSALLVTGCSTKKDKLVTATAISGAQQEIKITAITSPENSNNPCDKVGRMHNAFLDSGMHFIDQKGETEIAKAAGYILQCGDIAPACQSYMDKMPPALKQEMRDHNKLIDESKVSDKSKALLHELLAIISTIKTPGFNALKPEIIGLEQKIIDHPALPEQEKRMLLSVTSVARYSAYYWSGWLQQQDNQQAQPLATSVFERIGAALADMIDADNLATFVCAVTGTPPELWSRIAASKSMTAFEHAFLGN